MRFPIWCELVCPGCATTTAGRFTYTGVPHAAMRRTAMREGWVFANEDVYCSLKCVAKDAELMRGRGVPGGGLDAQPSGSQDADGA